MIRELHIGDIEILSTLGHRYFVFENCSTKCECKMTILITPFKSYPDALKYMEESKADKSELHSSLLQVDEIQEEELTGDMFMNCYIDFPVTDLKI